MCTWILTPILTPILCHFEPHFTHFHTHRYKNENSPKTRKCVVWSCLSLVDLRRLELPTSALRTHLHILIIRHKCAVLRIVRLILTPMLTPMSRPDTHVRPLFLLQKSRPAWPPACVCERRRDECRSPSWSLCRHGLPAPSRSGRRCLLSTYL